jgi:hypothetical protein
VFYTEFPANSKSILARKEKRKKEEKEEKEGSSILEKSSRNQ